MILVIGGGIAGVTTALEVAETGEEVVLVEKEPHVGGRVVRAYHYFPKHCPPTCGMEINIRRIERNPRVRVITSAQVTDATREDGGWNVTVASSPRYVKDSCTRCGACTKVCPARVPDPFNLGMADVAAVRLPYADAWPKRYVLDRHACPPDCTLCVEACSYEAIDLNAEVTTEAIRADAVVLATGWQPYALDRLNELRGGSSPYDKRPPLRDVIANVNLERLAALNGPTGGKILRPSDGKPPARVAFVQCAGSRDLNHLAYCSGVCCLASFKQAVYIKEQLPEAEITIFYIDRRAPGRNEEVLAKAMELPGVSLVKGKVGSISRNGDGSLALKVEDVASGQLADATADLVVLATGMMSNLRAAELPFGDLLRRDDDGFGLDNPEAGLFVAGVARRPEDVAASVRDATGVAGRALAVALSHRGGA